MVYKEFITFLLDFYHGYKVPSTVTEYCRHYPKGYSRTTIKNKFGVTVSQVLTDINSNYTKTNDKSTSISSVLDNCTEKNLIWLNQSEYRNSKLNNLLFKCTTCNNTFTTSYGSLRITKVGCPHCASNSPLVREEVMLKLVHIITMNNCSMGHTSLDNCTNINRDSLSKATVQVICTVCKSTFSKEISNMYYRNVCRCPVCFPSKVYPIVYNSITFNSKFELECYKLLIIKGIPIETHIRYSDILPTDKKYSCDFFIRKSNTIIEVTSYKEDSEYYIKHKETLDIKSNLALVNGFSFHVIRSLPELEKLIKLLKDIV